VNKHDFYKEIMSQYTFDEEKILKNAKRASSASFLARNSKWLPLVSAACLLITAVAVILPMALNDDGGFVTPPPVSHTASAEDRMLYMADIIRAGGITNEKKEIYLSFEEAMTPDELNAVLSDVASEDGSLELLALWNGGFVDAAQAGNTFYNGAKISAFDNLYFELYARAEFSAVEFKSDMVNDSNFQPIVNTPDPVNLPYPTDPIDPIDPVDPIDDPVDPIDDPVDPIDDPVDPIDDPVDPIDDPVDPIDDPVDPIDDPADPIQEFIELNIEGAQSVNFITENRFVVLTGSQIQLYEVTKNADNKHGIKAVTGYVAANPAIVYTDARTGTLLILGGDAFGQRTELFIAEGESGELKQLNVFGTGDIISAIYRNGEIVVGTANAIYVASRNGGYYFSVAEETEMDSLTVLGFTNGGFMYARNHFSETRIYRFNTANFISEEVDAGLWGISGEYSFVRSPNAGNFAVITNEGTYIWNASLSALSDLVPDASSVRFHRYSGNFITDGKGNWYQIQGTQLIPTTEREADELSPKQEFSSSYKILEITSSTVKIDIVQ